MNLARANPIVGTGRARTSVATATALTVLLLVGAGVGYRVAASGIRNVLPTRLPIPLSEVPIHLNGWVGEEMDIPEVTKRYMETYFADDYVSRRYVNASEGVYADVYVVYCSTRPSGILGHRPQRCFPGHGWIWDSTSPSEFVTESGRSVGCLVHRFHKPAPSYQEVVVLNFYVVNGDIRLYEKDFSSFWGRRPNISGNPARYVAQIQVSSVLEHSVRMVAEQVVEPILALMPDQDDRVDTVGLEGRTGRTAGAAEGVN